MNEKLHKSLSAILSLVICIVFGIILTIYINPMEDISLNLSMMLEDGAVSDKEHFDYKGWTVYVQDGEAVTELEPDGTGGFSGIELGQTFYYSRVMEESLGSPTLRLNPINRKFSVWLDDVLLYTDCPELDNRIGYLTLPMAEWDRSDPIIISLPTDYQGKTLTIAQSFPNYTESNFVKAYPATVMLYCGYAYESALISESFGTAILAAVTFAIGLILLILFVRSGDWGLLFLALVAFCGMTSQLTEASFFYKYWGTNDNSLVPVIRLLSTGALLTFLALRSGKYRKLLWGILSAYALAMAVQIVCYMRYDQFSVANPVIDIFAYRLPYWVAFAGLVCVLLLGTLFWRKEKGFYRLFTPLAICATLLYWMALIFFIEKEQVALQIVLNLQSGQITYIYQRILLPVTVATLLTALVEALQKEIDLHTEKRLLKDKQELVLENYENMRRQHEEVMMLRHDMAKHFQVLREMSGEEPVKSYLGELTGQNQKIRPVIQTGNEMLDIILGSKLSAAADAGVKIEIMKAEAPKELPLSDADLCSLVMNIMDNAVNAATGTGIADPYIRINIHTKGNYLAFLCENSANMNFIAEESKKETAPKHGLGLKIIQGIVKRYEGMLDTKYGENSYNVRVAIPLH